MRQQLCLCYLLKAEGRPTNEGDMVAAGWRKERLRGKGCLEGKRPNSLKSKKLAGARNALPGEKGTSSASLSAARCGIGEGENSGAAAKWHKQRSSTSQTWAWRRA